jgi:hypothetical protein
MTGRKMFVTSSWRCAAVSSPGQPLLLQKELGVNQGCQMVYFQAKYPNLGKFWRVLHRTMLVYFMAIWCTYGRAIWHILHISIWYFVCHFGMLYQEKSGILGVSDE